MCDYAKTLRESFISTPKIVFEVVSEEYSDNDYFIKVVYSLQGNCKLIGKGTNGRFRENISYKSPALVVEATGTCTIAWEGTRSDGTIVRGEYRYTDYDNVISIKKG